MAMTIREGRVQERDVLRRLLLEATAALGYPAPVMAEIRQYAGADPAIAARALAEGRVLVAEDEDGIVGFATVDPPGADGAAELTGLFVAPDRWLSGIGSELVDAAAARAAAKGAATLRVVASSGFYVRTGWSVVRETGTPLGHPAWILERPVRA
jgi:predicted N-acetyltransferase YhbS